MKTIFLSALFLVLASKYTSAQVYDKGNAVIDIYYGYVGPGAILSAVKAVEGEVNLAGTNYNPSTTIIGPLGLRAQYMVSPNFGLGLDVSYERKSAAWTDAVAVMDSDGFVATGPNGFATYENTNSSYSVTKVKMMIRTSWEFINTEKVSLNWANSIGYKTGERSFNNISDSFFSFSVSQRVWPIALRSALGARYFITDNIGAHIEFGVFGGGVILGGASFKL